MKYDVLEKVLIFAGVTIIITGFMLHVLTPKLYALYYRNVPLAFRTILPALTYGIPLVLMGICYMKAGSMSSTMLMVILLIVSNIGFAFVIHGYLTTSYGPEMAFEVYFFIAQTLTYPWIIANVAGIIYLYNFRHREQGDSERLEEIIAKS